MWRGGARQLTVLADGAPHASERELRRSVPAARCRRWCRARCRCGWWWRCWGRDEGGHRGGGRLRSLVRGLGGWSIRDGLDLDARDHPAIAMLAHRAVELPGTGLAE